jgi:iron uptake system component EfeO
LLPTFVIGLREGVEASLIVGIVAAFLRQQGRRDALRWTWVGVGLAIALCAGAAVALQVLDRGLPQREQEQLETVVAAVAVAMVTFMIVWMRRHAAGLAGMLRANAQDALAKGSVLALVAMAFFAVVREGLETAVFLLAAFQASGNALAAGGGALLGVLVAVAIGFGIYRGGVRLDLGRFFRVTAAVLVLVAAGLVGSAVHTAHEAAWLNDLQGRALDLSWLVRPGSVGSSLWTGMLGVQPQPTVGEAAAWLLYAVPMLLFVLWPDGRRPRLRWRRAASAVGSSRTRRLVATLALAAVAASIALYARVADGRSAKAAAPRTVRITLSDEGCSPARVTVPAGQIAFQVVNSGSAKVTELEVKSSKGIILGERENVVPGIPASFTLDLDPGRYTLSCPNGESHATGALIVTGRPVKESRKLDPLLRTAVAGYTAYVQDETDQLAASTRKFVAALRRGDLARAQALFAPTRRHYEAIEPVAESFGALDADIDARVNDVASVDDWTGFHRIEQLLWIRRTTRGTAPYATRLLADVTKLRGRVRTLDFQPAQLANGAVELLNEVATGKITGEEDRYSHTDLSDFQGNLTGAKVAFDALRPALVARGYGQLAATIAARFVAVQSGLDAYRRKTASGFADYRALTAPDRLALAQRIDALAEPLSTVASKIAR